VEPLRRLTPTHLRELDDEVQFVGAALGATPTLEVGSVTVGAHA
jgi:hypothetical protein